MPRQGQPRNNLNKEYRSAVKEEISAARQVYKDLGREKDQIVEKRKKLRAEYGGKVTRRM